MRLAFFGTPLSAVPFLEALVDDGHVVDPVVTQPDRAIGRSGRLRPPPVKVEAERRGLDVLQPKSIRRPAFEARLLMARPDVLVVVAFGRILPGGLLGTAPHGAVNVHFSLLPRYRGAAPVQWALARGESVTGVSTMRLDEGLDTGPIYERREVPIRPGEHAPALQRRLVEVGVGVLRSTLSGLARGDLDPVPQDDAASSLAPILTREDGHVDPQDPARAIEGRVRGFDPWPGVWLARGGRRVRLLEARAVPEETTADRPGTVLGLDDDGLRIACGGGSVLAVRQLQPDGGRAMSARDAVNGRRLVPGDVVERIA